MVILKTNEWAHHPASFRRENQISGKKESSPKHHIPGTRRPPGYDGFGMVPMQTFRI
ncbi:MAG: hypothetical protein CM1200mP18_10750 [Gammaproteobacteria bacterium]|nr:MAG: hypothetical protein CM1200mP18_10750 [Gammaproteobacteria bacterium]